MDGLDESLLRKTGKGRSNSVTPILKLSSGNSIEIAHISIWIACHMEVLVARILCLPQSPEIQELGPSSLEYSRETPKDSKVDMKMSF